MAPPSFRFVCVPSALVGAGGLVEWALEMLRDGEIALLPDDGGLDAISEVAHALGLASVPVIRGEADVEQQQSTVTDYARSLPLVWVGERFSPASTAWARERGPMTLLVQTGGPLTEEDRRRIERFVATLGRQSE